MVIGEEVEFELTTLLPVALLRTFVIRDELPPGVRCSEAPVVDLSAPPYSAAGFQPGGTFTPTCTDSYVEWNFGNQRITQGTTPDNRYPFSLRFIARVENSTLTNNAGVLSNGVPATQVTARYINEANAQVEHTFGQVDMVIREPRVALTKSFAPVVNADAADELQVTVTATNNGTSPAYNLRVMDDLTAGYFSYVGNIGGANAAHGGYRRARRRSADVQLAGGIRHRAGRDDQFHVRRASRRPAEPHKVLANTIHAAWTSLPIASTALNSTGQIGADGSATRHAQRRTAERRRHAQRLRERRRTPSVTVPALTLTKTDRNPALAPEIGAHKPFQIVVNLPEGATENLSSRTTSISASSATCSRTTPASTSRTSSSASTPSTGKRLARRLSRAVPADGASGTVVPGRSATSSRGRRTIAATQAR